MRPSFFPHHKVLIWLDNCELICQNGSWEPQATQLASFIDSFNLVKSDFKDGTVGGCGPARNYEIDLKHPAIIHSTMYVVALGGQPMAGIVVGDGAIMRHDACSYNRDHGTNNSSVSTSCSTIVPAGKLKLRLCVGPYVQTAKGSVLVQYINNLSQ